MRLHPIVRACRSAKLPLAVLWLVCAPPPAVALQGYQDSNVFALDTTTAGAVDPDLPPGPAQAEWDGRDDTGRELASGIYPARLRKDGSSRCARMDLIR